nr:zinc ribbon domain-containing protein [Candidatus Sigynarchaeum springense]
MPDCQSCGRTNLPQARFCISCGKPLPRTDKVACPSCNKLNNNYNMFCIHCGAKISQQSAEWKEADLKVSSQPATEAPWKDENVIYCPSCNYGCQKDWPVCPMCKTPIGGTGSAHGVPMFVDDAGEPAAPLGPVFKPKAASSPQLKASVLKALAPVIASMDVISIPELARRVNSDEEAVSTVVKELIATDAVEGHIDVSTNEFISEVDGLSPRELFIQEPPATGTAPAAQSHADADSAPRIIGESDMSDLKAVIQKERGMDIDEFVKELVNALEIKRGYDFEGGSIHFKVVVKNNSKLVIHDVKIYLDASDFFKTEEDEQGKSLPTLNPGESRGIDFYLDPKKCGTADISATVLFKDIYGKRHAKLVPPVEVQVKQPIIAPSKSSIEYIKEQTSRMASDMKMFAIKDLDSELLYNAAFRAISKFDMSCAHDEKRPDSLEAWFSAISKTDKEPIIARIIMGTTGERVLEIRVWCNDDKQLTGFLAKIITNLRDEIELIRRIKAEDKSQALKLMALGRNIEVLKNYAGLNWEAGDISNVLHEVKGILMKSFSSNKDVQGVIAEINVWIDRMNSLKTDEHISQEFGNKLYTDVEHWQDIINMQLGIVQKS